jgi:hypothetical protein
MMSPMSCQVGDVCTVSVAGYGGAHACMRSDISQLLEYADSYGMVTTPWYHLS